MNFIKTTTTTQLIENKEEITSQEPCIPYDQTLMKIPQNLPIGTSYSIGIQEYNPEETLGNKLNSISSILNNITEILSFLILRQLHEIATTIQGNLTPLQTILNQRTEIVTDRMSAQIQMISTLSNQLSTIINTYEQSITLSNIKELLAENKVQTKSPINITPPIRLT